MDAPTMDATAIQSLAMQWQASRALLAAFELNLFTVLGHEAMTGVQVAARADTDPRATDRLLRAMVPLGLIELRGDCFANTEGARKYLDRASPDCLSLNHAAFTYKNWASLDGAVRQGTAVISTDFDTEERRAAFIEHMHTRAKGSADGLIARIDLKGVRRVLDVGGGSGAYSMAFCRAGKNVSATILDLPEVAGLTRGYIQREGFAGSIEVREGDYHQADFGAGYDLVFFSAIIHINSLEQNAALIKKAAEALNPGGRVVVQDFIMQPGRVEPAYGTLFALNMLVNTASGDTYTEDEVRDWMRAAGLTPGKPIATGPTTSMMVGRKPS